MSDQRFSHTACEHCQGTGKQLASYPGYRIWVDERDDHYWLGCKEFGFDRPTEEIAIRDALSLHGSYFGQGMIISVISPDGKVIKSY